MIPFTPELCAFFVRVAQVGARTSSKWLLERITHDWNMMDVAPNQSHHNHHNTPNITIFPMKRKTMCKHLIHNITLAMQTTCNVPMITNSWPYTDQLHIQSRKTKQLISGMSTNTMSVSWKHINIYIYHQTTAVCLSKPREISQTLLVLQITCKWFYLCIPDSIFIYFHSVYPSSGISRSLNFHQTQTCSHGHSKNQNHHWSHLLTAHDHRHHHDHHFDHLDHLNWLLLLPIRWRILAWDVAVVEIRKHMIANIKHKHHINKNIWKHANNVHIIKMNPKQYIYIYIYYMQNFTDLKTK